MARTNTTPVAVLRAVTARLQDALHLNDATCFISLPGMPIDVNPGTLYVTIEPGGGSFGQGMLDGGGRNQLSDDSTLVTVVHTRLNVDELGRATQALTDATLGLLAMYWQVVDTLTIWDAQDTDGNEILREPMRPLSHGDPQWDQDTYSKQVVWQTMFDWDLS